MPAAITSSHGPDDPEALTAYESLRVLLREELGIAPSAETQALHLETLHGAGRGKRRPPGPADSPVAPREPRTTVERLL